MINIYTLIASRRKRGVSNHFAELINTEIEKNFLKKGEKINKTIKYIEDYNIRNCSGCQSCFRNGKCIFHDDQELFIQDISDSDIIIFCVPVYINNVPGDLKSLLDRIAYLMHLMPFIGKHGILFTSTSLSGKEMVEGYMEMIFSYLGISLDLKIGYFDKEKILKDDDISKIQTFVDLYINNNFEIPQLLNQVFKYYHNHFTPYKDLDIDDNELKYWVNNYLCYNNIEEVLKYKIEKKEKMK